MTLDFVPTFCLSSENLSGKEFSLSVHVLKQGTSSLPLTWAWGGRVGAFFSQLGKRPCQGGESPQGQLGPILGRLP